MKKGSYHSEETKQKMREMRIGTHHSEETKQKMRENHANFSGKNSPSFGHHPTEETRRKISESLTGHHPTKETRRKLSERMKGKQNSKGHKHTEEQRRQQSERMKGEKHPMYGKYGPEAANWRGGVSSLPYAPEFNEALKREIRKRDSYTCRWCGIFQSLLRRRLDVHHIDFDKKNNNSSNLCALCQSCHMAITLRGRLN